jgi:hypothetical protein
MENFCQPNSPDRAVASPEPRQLLSRSTINNRSVRRYECEPRLPIPEILAISLTRVARLSANTTIDRSAPEVRPNKSGKKVTEDRRAIFLTDRTRRKSGRQNRKNDTFRPYPGDIIACYAMPQLPCKTCELVVWFDRFLRTGAMKTAPQLSERRPLFDNRWNLPSKVNLLIGPNRLSWC